MKIALYESKYSTGPNEFCDWIEENLEYVRVSEVVEVEFPRLTNEEIVPNQVNRLDTEIQKVRAEMFERIDFLEDQKAKLLAITYDGES